MERISYFEAGQEHYLKKEYKEAIDCFIHGIAESNCRGCLAWLGNCHEYGLGVPKDLVAAKDLYLGAYKNLPSSEMESRFGVRVQEHLECLKDIPVYDTMCKFIEGVGNVKVIRRLETPYDPQVRYNLDELVVTVQARSSLYLGFAFAQVKVVEMARTWTCDGERRFYDGYTLDTDLFSLKVLRGKTDKYTSRLDGRNCYVYFPQKANLDYIYVQQSILKKVRNLLVKRARVALPPILKEVADRTGTSFQKCEVTSAVRDYLAYNYGKGKKIVFSVNAVQLPMDSVEALCIHELAHNFVNNHSSDFYNKMIELGGEAAYRRDLNLRYKGKWPYLKFI